MDLDALLEYCDADRDTVLKLHRFGMLWALPMDSKRKRPLRRALDRTYPEDIPSREAAGLYHLAFRVAYGKYDFSLLTKPLIPPRFSEAYKFLESSTEERALLHERRPETYARLKKEAKLLQTSGRYSCRLLDRIHPLNDAEAQQVIKFLRAELTSIQFKVIDMQYLQGMICDDIAGVINRNSGYVYDISRKAIKYLRQVDRNILLQTVFTNSQPRPNGATPPRQPPSP